MRCRFDGNFTIAIDYEFIQAVRHKFSTVPVRAQFL
jgi:hypothetical protein